MDCVVSCLLQYWLLTVDLSEGVVDDQQGLVVNCQRWEAASLPPSSLLLIELALNYVTFKLLLIWIE